MGRCPGYCQDTGNWMHSERMDLMVFPVRLRELLMLCAEKVRIGEILFTGMQSISNIVLICRAGLTKPLIIFPVAIITSRGPLARRALSVIT